MQKPIKKHLTPIAILSIISWTGFILVIFRLEPCRTYSSTEFCNTTSSLAMILFYASLFFALTGTFTILGYLSRVWIYKTEIYTNHLNISLRQGILLSICSMTILAFLSLNILRWWTTILLLLTIILIEFYFLSKESAHG